ncbi:Autoinducer binding domain-containing protein [Cognatiyoonia koreensis]|uniref:Autoinducer binding domain-containing protein n=1 Tax=Cognatiyoonia koreensis TaxID=364200 RepID=A0A1I0RXW4_9RHOB|nr:LuxR family transcriptional regulator [Cognatiyoonia koreensis]SEW46305.1 Autoinducer binding domain-containing protein [Cognatiyoonia koreensis]
MLSERASELEQLDSIDVLWNQTLAALANEGAAFAIYNTVSSQKTDPFVLTNIPQIFADVCSADDPFLAHCCKSYDITRTGPAYLPSYEYLPNEAKAFIRAAADTGFQTGIGIPMRLQGSNRYGGFNIGTRMDCETFEKTIMPRAEEFRFFCLLVHRRIEELTREGLSVAGDFRDLLVAPDQPNLDVLSPREKEVIYLVAQGISRKECARLCGISPNTVAEYTKSAYRKLGVQNRVEAANLVMRQAG